MDFDELSLAVDLLHIHNYTIVSYTGPEGFSVYTFMNDEFIEDFISCEECPDFSVVGVGEDAKLGLYSTCIRDVSVVDEIIELLHELI